MIATDPRRRLRMSSVVAAIVTNLVHVVPIGLAVTHQATAMAIVGLWVCAVHHVRHLAVASPQRTPADPLDCVRVGARR